MIDVTASINELIARGWNVASTEDTGACSDPSSKYWTGDINTDWNMGGNWHNLEVLVAGDQVIIPSRSNQPILSAITPLIKRLDIILVAMLTVDGNGQLNLEDLK